MNTKASLLASLKGKIKSAKLLSQVSFSHENWQSNRTDCLSKLQSLGEKVLACRSSALDEDQGNQSNAGKYLSLLNVSKENIENSIEEVFSSYGKYLGENQILIQPMLQDVCASGVAFSHDQNSGQSTLSISISFSNSTDIVTLGKKGSETWKCQLKAELKTNNKIIDNLRLLIEELYELFNTPVDIEFCIDKNNVIYLLQVRPLVCSVTPEHFDKGLKRCQKLEKEISFRLIKKNFISGKKNLLGVMPDWNPAEIIGLKPRPLSFSLYREWITDGQWAYQRNNYGYRNLRSHPLLIGLNGSPYIDTRVSFNSFIPKDIDDELGDRIVNIYLDSLDKKPSFHDKVEFEIVISSWTFNIDKKLEYLLKKGVSKKELKIFRNKLKKITNKLLKRKKNLVDADISRLIELKRCCEKISQSNIQPLEKAYWLTEYGKRYGSLPFAGLARAAFVAVEILNSLVDKDLISANDADNFKRNISTVSKKMKIDKFSLSKEKFIKKYGHLRPGTYDIRSSRYDKNPDYYFSGKDTSDTNDNSSLKANFNIEISKLEKINVLLKREGIKCSSVELFSFLKKAIEAREEAKFIFTKYLSDSIEMIADVGMNNGFSRDDISYINYGELKNYFIEGRDLQFGLRESIEKGKIFYQETVKTTLPSLIRSPNDAWYFKETEILENYITSLSFSGEIEIDLTKDLEGKAVLISSADPGYDWIFSRNIGALITAWGGINSHMAIRCEELAIPAIIGLGDSRYKKISNYRKIEIDCQSKIFKISE